MDHYSIVTSLKRIDKKFTEQLTESDRQAAFRKFKKVYAQEMAKLTNQISKRQKIQENITQISEKEANKTKEIDQDIKKRMEKHSLNREKYQENIEKESKMLDENWKRKLEEINRKKREKQRDAIRKAEKIRRDGEQYWNNKKSLTSRITKDDRSSTPNKAQPFTNRQTSPQNLLSVPINPLAANFYNNTKKTSDKYFLSSKTEEKKISFLLPDLKKTKINLKLRENKTLNESISEHTHKNDDIKVHLDRTERVRKEQQQANFQKIMQKLDRIEKSRKTVQQKLENDVKQAKRNREIRQSPEVHAANRQRSIENLHSKSRTKRADKSTHSKVSLSGSKNSMSQSIEKHLNLKKQIEENEFNDRENTHELKMQRIKHNKINRLIHEAINQIKQKTLNELQ